MQKISLFIAPELREAYKQLAKRRKEDLQRIHKRAGYQELMRQALTDYLEREVKEELTA